MCELLVTITPVHTFPFTSIKGLKTRIWMVV
jgi:hypothetical protein